MHPLIPGATARANAYLCGSQRTTHSGKLQLPIGCMFVPLLSYQRASLQMSTPGHIFHHSLQTYREPIFGESNSLKKSFSNLIIIPLNKHLLENAKIQCCISQWASLVMIFVCLVPGLLNGSASRHDRMPIVAQLVREIAANMGENNKT
jgi:hypothetical protein